MGLALLKLGGSVVTFKKKPLSINRAAISRISKELRKVRKPLILVHGGGSFGHHYSVRYGMHTRPARYDLHGVSVVRSSMIDLNNQIVKIMMENRLNPYTVPPSALVRAARAVRSKIRELRDLAVDGRSGSSISGLIPVTHGDILYHGKRRYYIFSGDVLMSMLARELKPEIVVFALDVDGVYGDLKSKNLVREIRAMNQASFSKVQVDVTGSMNRKLREAFKMSRMGLDVLMVNGLKPERIVRAINGKSVEGTVVRGVK